MNGSEHPPQGRVIAVRGSVVDVRFEEASVPVGAALRAGENDAVRLEVVEERDAATARTLALTRTTGLARGDPVRSLGGPLRVPVGAALLGRVVDVFGEPLDGLGSIVTEASQPQLKPSPPLGRHSVRSEILRTGQGHRSPGPARTRWQDRTLRRRWRRQDRPGHRAHPQHRRAPPRREPLRWHRRALARGPGAHP